MITAYRLKYFILDLLFILGIIATVYFFVDFRFGQYLFTGDFRFHIDKALIGDQFVRLVSDKFSNNNFVFLAFYPLYFFLQFIPYHYILVYIFFGIPVFLFLSTKYILTKFSNFNYNNILLYLFISSLAFYFAINPSLFNRFGHWPVLHGTIFFPLYIYCLYKYFCKKASLNKFFWLLPLLLFLGAITPHLIVVYLIASTLLYFSTFFICRKNPKQHLSKGFLLFCGALVSFFHILYPALIGQGRTKSLLESATTSNILSSLARHSNIVSAISGTNYYYELIKFPTELSVGFLIFLLSLFLFLTRKEKDRINALFLLLSLTILIVVTGYGSFKFVLDFFNQRFLSQFTWLVKDPNMYYLFFLLPVLLLLTRLISSAHVQIKKPCLVLFAFLFLGLNIIFTFSSDRSDFNKFYDFINLPEEYFTLAEELKDGSARNLWLPSGVYISKNFSDEITYFPSPSLWLTKNKELTPSTPEYASLISFIESQIYNEDCENINLLNWLIAVQNLNIIIDRNSVNNPLTDDYSIEPKIKKLQICLEKLPNAYKYKTIGNIDIFKSNLELQQVLYSFKGPLDSLNSFLEINPVNIVYQPSEKGEVETIQMSHAVLNESYDENWLDLNNNPAKAKVNFASMLFDDDQEFHYRGERQFLKIVAAQKIILVFFVILFIRELLFNHAKK